VDFAQGAKQFAVTAAALGGCTITLRLDKPNGSIVGTVDVKDTGSLEKYREFTAKVKNAAGVHDLYICFGKTTGDVRLDWWMFE
jgi:hypothetical protein